MSHDSIERGLHVSHAKVDMLCSMIFHGAKSHQEFSLSKGVDGFSRDETREGVK